MMGRIMTMIHTYRIHRIIGWLSSSQILDWTAQELTAMIMTAGAQESAQQKNGMAIQTTTLPASTG